MLTKHSSTAIEAEEQVEPLRYIEKVLPSKYSTIFSERLFISKETVAAFFVEIFEVEGSVSPPPADKKASKGPAPEVTEIPLTGSFLMGLTLLEEEQKVAYVQGFNRCTLHYIRFKPGTNYTLGARFIGDKPDYSKLHFSIRVYSTETIGIVRDSIKEDAEKAIRSSWEEKQPGRAANAK